MITIVKIWRIKRIGFLITLMWVLFFLKEDLIQSVEGSHANSLHGRFAYMHEKITSLCKELLATERLPNEQVIFVEIIHLPEGRIGKIARRPVLSDYEIPFLASSALGVESQISITIYWYP
jgi:hypothetical protein